MRQSSTFVSLVNPKYKKLSANDPSSGPAIYANQQLRSVSAPTTTFGCKAAFYRSFSNMSIGVIVHLIFFLFIGL
jgi:hypothetical protein